jgi:hypothetical protein
MSHPYNDPFHSGLVQLTPSQRLMNADLLRRRGMSGLPELDEGVEGPLSGLADSVGEVLGAAGYGRPKEPKNAQNSGDEQPPEEPPAAPEPKIQNDAEPQQHGVFSDGEGGMVHVRPMTGASAGRSGRFAPPMIQGTVLHTTPVGGPLDGTAPERTAP